ncbi:hypothetical protein B484DRAFT_465075, partial [Ochromonadaceae sp. CCMP2298]
VFGKYALKIVDYYEAIAAGKSVPRVVLCEVAGVLCDAAEGESNISAGLEISQMFTHFYQFIATQFIWEPCQPPLANKWEHTDLVNFFLKEYEKRPDPLPTLTFNITALVEHSAAWDTTVRKSFGGNITYGNASANLRHAQSSIHVAEVDVEKLLSD